MPAAGLVEKLGGTLLLAEEGDELVDLRLGVLAGHPRQSGVGGKDDVRALKQYMIDLKEAVRVAAGAGKCFDTAMREIKLPKYEQWQRYSEFLPLNIERLCHYWLFGWQ